jgi:signal transduction histidine kinase
MTGWRVQRLPASLVGLTLAVELTAVALSWDLESRYDTLLYALYSVSLAVAGGLVASRQPRNAVGWLFLGFALMNATTADVAQGWGLRAAAEGWPGVPVGEWLSAASWLPSGFGWVLTFLLFPDGHLPSGRWRPVPWLGGLGLVLALPGWALSPDRAQDFSGGRNPLVVDALPHGPLLAVGMSLYTGALAASAVALVLRFRRSRDVERQQLKLFALAAAFAGVALPVTFVLWYAFPPIRPLAALALTALPMAAGTAILRYRLYDVDVVLNRTLVYGALTMLLVLTYGATTVLLGTALGHGSAWATAGATLVVAAAFRPLRGVVQDGVDRRFNRARYDALRRMADFLQALRDGRSAPEEVEGVLRELVCDPRLELLFFLPGSASYVDARGVPAAPSPDDGREPVLVTRGDQRLGLVLHDPSGEDRSALLRRVLEAAALAIEIARLQVELRRHIAEVEASRARIIEAGDQERRRIERDLHDGAQQRLVAIGLALRHAQHELRGSAPQRASSTLDAAVAEIEVAVAELRELARGLPPAQLDAGLAPAFRELARRAPLPVVVTAPSERFDQGVESAAYFIGCEGLTNAVKHARASRVELSADRRDGSLVVRIGDDGVGGAAPVPGSGLSGLTDRVAALGGTLRIESDAGTGTTLTAELPCRS